MNEFLVAPGCSVPASEIQWKFTTSSGPGGQHTNRSNTAVTATLDLRSASGLEDETRQRLLSAHGSHLRVHVEKYRSQARNRALAQERLVEKMVEALTVQKRRRPTKKSRGSQRRRLHKKRQRSQLKSSRRRPSRDEH